MKMKRERKIHLHVSNDIITGYRYIFFSIVIRETVTFLHRF